MPKFNVTAPRAQGTRQGQRLGRGSGLGAWQVQGLGVGRGSGLGAWQVQGLGVGRGSGLGAWQVQGLGVGRGAWQAVNCISNANQSETVARCCGANHRPRRGRGADNCKNNISGR